MKIADHHTERGETTLANSAHMRQLREYGRMRSVGCENYASSKQKEAL